MLRAIAKMRESTGFADARCGTGATPRRNVNGINRMETKHRANLA
jgi:hypothetical protein